MLKHKTHERQIESASMHVYTLEIEIVLTLSLNMSEHTRELLEIKEQTRCSGRNSECDKASKLSVTHQEARLLSQQLQRSWSKRESDEAF